MSAGQAITKTDVDTHAQVIDLGASVASGLFPAGSDPIGQQVTVGSAQFTVIGLLASKGSTGLTNSDAVVIAPYTAVQDQLTGESQSFSELLVQGKSAATFRSLKVKSKAFWRLRTTPRSWPSPLKC